MGTIDSHCSPPLCTFSGSWEGQGGGWSPGSWPLRCYDHVPVSLVAMLSAPEAYTGGRSCFRRGAGRSGHREVALGKGDIVLFRGEKLEHWITPVTKGRRTILQIELSRV